MLRNIHLHGRLKKEFGATHRFDVTTAGEAFRALNCAFPGKFVAALKEGYFKIVRGDKRSGLHLDLDLLNSFGLGQADLHVIPVAKGASNGKGAGKAVLGAALIGGAIFLSGGTLAAPLASLGSAIVPGMSITWGNIAAIGLGVMLMGASTLLTKPDTPAANDNSFSLSGTGQTAQQGQCIPVIVGRCMVKPVTVSIDADIEDVGAYQGANDQLGAMTSKSWGAA